MSAFINNVRIGLTIAVLSGCAHQNSIKTTTAVARPSGFVLVREYVDSVKTDHGDEYRKVQYGWDYDQGVAVQRISNMDDKLISTRAEPNLTLETTPNELEYAYSLIRQHPDLRKIASQKDALLHGGFSLTTDPNEVNSGPANSQCGLKSRCIHIIISGGLDGEKSLAHAIVNLASGLIVDAHYRGEKSFVSKVK